MSLVKSPRLTERKLAALRRNAKRSHGPATLEGLDRIRAAQLRHGLYAQAEGEALRSWGKTRWKSRSCGKSCAANGIPAMPCFCSERWIWAFAKSGD